MVLPRAPSVLPLNWPCSLSLPGQAIPDPKFGVYVIYTHYIYPELKDLRLPLLFGKGSRATLEGAPGEQRGTAREHRGSTSEHGGASRECGRAEREQRGSREGGRDSGSTNKIDRLGHFRKNLVIAGSTFPASTKVDPLL